MAINKISQEKINQIKQKSVITLPNQPKISAEELKARFVKPIVDNSNSMIQELDRIVEETNAELDGINDTLQNHESRIGELEQFAETLETNITKEIEDALDNKADLVDGKVPREQLPDVEDVLTGDITCHNHATEIGNHNASENSTSRH
jgi:DNA mismatch repair ATPase MutS